MEIEGEVSSIQDTNEASCWAIADYLDIVID